MNTFKVFMKVLWSYLKTLWGFIANVLMVIIIILGFIFWVLPMVGGEMFADTRFGRDLKRRIDKAKKDSDLPRKSRKRVKGYNPPPEGKMSTPRYTPPPPREDITKPLLPGESIIPRELSKRACNGIDRDFPQEIDNIVACHDPEGLRKVKEIVTPARCWIQDCEGCENFLC